MYVHAGKWRTDILQRPVANQAFFRPGPARNLRYRGLLEDEQHRFGCDSPILAFSGTLVFCLISSVQLETIMRTVFYRF